VTGYGITHLIDDNHSSLTSSLKSRSFTHCYWQILVEQLVHVGRDWVLTMDEKGWKDFFATLFDRVNQVGPLVRMWGFGHGGGTD
jgi:hypothetical protein